MRIDYKRAFPEGVLGMTPEKLGFLKADLEYQHDWDLLEGCYDNIKGPVTELKDIKQTPDYANDPIKSKIKTNLIELNDWVNKFDKMATDELMEHFRYHDLNPRLRENEDYNFPNWGYKWIISCEGENPFSLGIDSKTWKTNQVIGRIQRRCMRAHLNSLGPIPLEGIMTKLLGPRNREQTITKQLPGLLGRVDFENENANPNQLLDILKYIGYKAWVFNEQPFSMDGRAYGGAYDHP